MDNVIVPVEFSFVKMADQPARILKNGWLIHSHAVAKFLSVDSLLLSGQSHANEHLQALWDSCHSQTILGGSLSFGTCTF